MTPYTTSEPARFALPNGVVIEAVLSGDGADDHRGEWKSIDITATHPNGIVDTLCAVDWEAGRGTRSLVFDIGTEDPIYTQLYREIDEATPILKEISIQELALSICSLNGDDILKFYADRDEKGGCELYGVKKIDAFEASHVLINYFGGNSPYVIDMTTAEDDAKLIEEALNNYLDYCGIKTTYVFERVGGKS